MVGRADHHGINAFIGKSFPEVLRGHTTMFGAVLASHPFQAVIEANLRDLGEIHHAAILLA